MESGRFDALSRRIGAVQDRRRLLSLLGGAVLTALGRNAALAAQNECASRCPSGEYCAGGVCVPGCRNNRDCRNKHDDPCLLHQCIEGVCASAIVDCLPGYECCTGSCCPAGCSDDSQCVVFEPCWRGQCGTDGQCEFIELNPCVVCEWDDDCLDSAPNTTCCEGACRRPCPEGTVMGKGCECGAIGLTSMDDVLVRDDASG
jgi:hypothetical protein